MQVTIFGIRQALYWTMLQWQPAVPFDLQRMCTSYDSNEKYTLIAKYKAFVFHIFRYLKSPSLSTCPQNFAWWEKAIRSCIFCKSMYLLMVRKFQIQQLPANILIENNSLTTQELPLCDTIWHPTSWSTLLMFNGLLLVRHHAITWTNTDLLSNGPLGTNLGEILIKIQIICI